MVSNTFKRKCIHLFSLGLSERRISELKNAKYLDVCEALDERLSIFREEIRGTNQVNVMTAVEVYRKCHFKCQRCLAHNNLTIDHIIPKSKGGSNRIENLQVLCFQCNVAKGDNIQSI